MRLPFGILSGRRNTSIKGLQAALAGYGLLALGAALTFSVLWVLDPAAPDALADRSLAQVYSSVTPASVLVSVVVGAASAFVVASQRTVLMSGVYLALALVPSMSLAGIALVNGNVALAGRALAVWAVPAASVVLVGGLVLALKRAIKGPDALEGYSDFFSRR